MTFFFTVSSYALKLLEIRKTRHVGRSQRPFVTTVKLDISLTSTFLLGISQKRLVCKSYFAVLNGYWISLCAGVARESDTVSLMLVDISKETLNPERR